MSRGFLFLSILFLILYTQRILAQKEANNWIFGQNAGITFNTYPPSPLSAPIFNVEEGCASISDKAGNLLFYSDGKKVFTLNHTVMPGSTVPVMNGHISSTQNVIILPQPENDSIYYLFTADAEPASSTNSCGGCFSYHRVNMRANGGIGAVITKNIVIRSPVTEKLLAVGHANGKDYWVIVHGHNSDAFYSYLLDASGINTVPVISNVGTTLNGPLDFAGVLKASPSGKLIVNALYDRNRIELFDFNNATGILSNPILTAPILLEAYGAEFSPDESKLYVTALKDISPYSHVYQLDLSVYNEPAISASATIIGGGPYYHSQIQLGPDGKIYGSQYQRNYLSVIHEPDKKGLACNFQANSINLNGELCNAGLPNFTSSYLKFPFLHTLSCSGDTAHFSLNPPGSASAVLWDFGDPASGSANTSALFSPYHIYSAPGSYEVRLIKYYPLGSPDTSFRTVNIVAPQSVQIQSSPAFICKGDTIHLAVSGLFLREWSVKGQGTVLGTDTILKAPVYAPTSFTIRARDRNGCNVGDTVLITPRIPPVNITASDDTVCQGEPVLLSASGAASYSWLQGGVPVSANDKLFLNPAVGGTFILLGTDAAGCKNSDTISVVVQPLPVLSIALSSSSVCSGDSIRLLGQGAADYLWTEQANPSLVLGTDSVLTVAPTTSSTYVLTGTDIYGCTGKDTASFTVKKRPPQRRIAGVPYVCPGITGVSYRVTDTIPSAFVSSSTFYWSITNGSPSSGQVLTRDSLRIDFSSTPGTAIIRAVETNAEGCAGDTLIFPTVIKTIFTPPAPSGNTILCSKDSPAQTYSTPFNTPGSVYTWHVSGGSILSGNGTSQAIVSWNQPSGGRIWYEENSTTATANCYGSSDTLYITIKPSPDPGPIKGNTALCAGTGTYYVNAHTGALYQWSLTNGSILSGSGTSVITAGWTGPGADTLVLVETASNGCATDPIKLPVTVYSVPVISELTGNTELCELSGPQQYIALSPTSATSRFLWSARNGTVTGRPDDDTVTVKWKTDQSLSYSLSVIEISKDSCPGQPFGKTLRLSGSSPSITSVSCVRELKAIEIAWAPGTAFQPYDLYRRALSGADTSWKVLKKKLYTPHYTDTLVNYGLHPYQYSYSTFACNDTVFSMPHNSIQLNALAGHNSVRLSWNRYNNWKENVARYEVWKKTDQETDYSFLLSAGHDTSAEVSTIHGFSHCFAVKAIENSTSNAAWSSHLCLETPHPVSVPSAFSPNGDGVNDIWVINGILSYPGSILEIFNRWGEKVFEAAGYQNNWNGTFNGKRLPDGTYFYILDLRSPAEGTKTRYNGNVTIAR